MRHIDITFDLETTATTANAAVMQIAAVAWNRNATDDPFSIDSETAAADTYFNRHIDLRTCVVDGFDFDQDTINWWSRQSDAAKHAVTDDLPEPIEEVFIDFIHWIEDVKKSLNAESICLWCQGMDFDGAILRNICRKYDLQLPFKHQQFSDCRTVIREGAVSLASSFVAAKSADVASLSSIPSAESGKTIPSPAAILANDRLAYELYEPLPAAYAEGHEAHDALYDCLRSSWNTWQALRWLLST